MSTRELHEWYEYYNQEPFMADRLEIQLARVCHIAGSFGGSKAEFSDYMISNKSKTKKSKVNSLLTKVKGLFTEEKTNEGV